MSEKTKKATVKGKLILQLESILDEEGIIDISVGAEDALCVSRRMLLNAAKELAMKPHHYMFRFRKGVDTITVLSRFNFKPTIERLNERYLFRR